ncbi:MAG: sulfatase [Kiritimatiellia bacterium]|jgi:N-sulfoglucosamine sulfohydrolase|nr:sulfatase [Kiritimatiellia bacterium]
MIATLCGVLITCYSSVAQAQPKRTNILIITVDDMNCDSVGVYGCKLKDTTPQMDRLASRGIRFNYAHVQVANCMPSRNTMWSGLYPHTHGVDGFRQVKEPKFPTLCDLMKKNSYFTAIRGKDTHSTPYHPYPWDLVLNDQEKVVQPKKNAQSFYRSTKRGISAAKEAKKPFCVMVNISDPHKPFYALHGNGTVWDDPNRPSKVFEAKDVPIPGFLYDHPDVRKELAHYYSSVRRADDCLGAALKALDESGERDNTFILFLSDHGMPFPFAKTQVYHHSTRTPLIVCQPGVIKPNSVDNHHMVSAVDFLPTILEAAGIKNPAGFNGRSFYPLVKGEKQNGRDMIFKDYNECAGRIRQPMRSVETRKYCYIFNPWSDGKALVKTATQGTKTYRTMKELAHTDNKIAARLRLFDHRVVEELYDIENDPDSLNNLVDDPAHAEAANRLRKHLEDWMEETNDHALEAFRKRNNKQALASYMADQQAQVPKRTKKTGKSR